MRRRALGGFRREVDAMTPSEIADGVTLRLLDEADAAEFAANLNRAREHIRPWVGPAFVTDSVEGARATIRRYADSAAADKGRLFGLWERGGLLGGVMFVSFDEAWGTCELGCWLQPGAEGRGLVIRSASALLDWAFGERGIERAEWRCRTDNARSAAVARRLGMRSEGVLRSAWVFDGKRFDTEIFSLLKKEWEVGAR